MVITALWCVKLGSERRVLAAGHSASLHTLTNGPRAEFIRCSVKMLTSTAMAYYVDRAGERCVFKQAKNKAVTFQETRRVSTTGRCCAKSGLLLARLLGRSTCLLSGPWGLLFVADLWGPGRPSQLSASFLANACVYKGGCCFKYLGCQADNRQQVEESPGERVGNLLQVVGN